MILIRCLVLATGLSIVVSGVAQTAVPAVPGSPSAAVFGGDERATRLAGRYKAMLAANPTEGIALDRLWKAWEDHGASAALIDECRREAESGSSASAWLVYGYVLKKAGRLDEADAAFDQAIQADSGGWQPPIAKGELALTRNQPSLAAPCLEQALSLMPANDRRRVDLLMKLGNAWIAAGQPEKAAESWEKIIAANPSNLALHQQLAELCARNHLSDRALVHYEYIEQHADPPAQAAAFRESGRLHENRGEFEAARNAYERGLALTFRDNWLNGELQTALIRLYEREGREPELEASWRRSAEQAPRDLGGFLRLLTLAEARGDTVAQKEWLEKIVTLAPRDRDSRLKLARLLANTGEREQAAGLYDRLLQDIPDQLEWILARSDLDIQSGHPEAAVSRLQACLSKHPTDESFGTPIVEFFLGHHLDEPAERIFRAAVERQPATVESSVALAKFYFSRHRLDDGRRVLASLTNQPGSDQTQAERWQRLAAIYQDENLPDDALRCWTEAEKLAPQAPATKVAISELLAKRGHGQEAADALTRAIDTMPDGAEREEIEHKLFHVLATGFDQSAGSHVAGTVEAEHSGRVTVLTNPMRLVPGRARTASVVPGGPLDRYLDSLKAATVSRPTSAAFLRLARWQAWAHRPADANDAAEKALLIDADNVPARIFLVTLATDARQYTVALKRLRELVALDPAKRIVYLRQMAGLQMEEGDHDAALSVYGELVEQQPGALEPLSEFAQAQQRVEHWFDALATWRRAYALPSLTPAQRSEVRRPLIVAYEHLGQFRQAAELLELAVNTEPDVTRKQELFRELDEFCGKHALNDWLIERCETALQNQPTDYFTMLAVAKLRQRKGKETEAYQLLRRAYYDAPDPIAALKLLAETAEDLGEDEQAISDRRKLVGMTGQNTAENLEKLAALEENSFDEDAATKTWEQIVARFSRDPSALAQAVEFFERIELPGRARSLLSQVIALDSTDVPKIFHLAELDRDADDREAARAHFESVLAQSDPEKPGDPLILPDDLQIKLDPAAGTGGIPGLAGLFSSVSLPKASASKEEGFRLRAIRELARLLPVADAPQSVLASVQKEARPAWIRRWQTSAANGARSEPLQALYAAGESRGVMDLLAGWLAEKPTDETLRTAFLLAGLYLRDYGRIASWTWPEKNDVDTGHRGLLLLEALQQYLTDGGRPGDDMVSALFPLRVQARDLLWKAARECFADRHWYAQAAELGERIIARLSSGRSVYAVETAQWDLYLGRADRARDVLASAIAEGNGSSYDGLGGSAVFQALRAYYLLLPTDQQQGFVDDYLRRWRERGEQIHVLLSAILLHGLHGDEETAKRELDTLLSMGMVGQDAGGSPDVGRWNYLLANGAQLQSWNLGPLAVHLWRSALREVTAFDRQNPGLQSTLNEMRARLLSLEVAMASNPEEARERVTAYLYSDPPMGTIATGAAQFMASSQFAAARQFYEYLTTLEPSDGENWRNLLNVCGSEGDTDTVERILNGLLEGKGQLPAALNRAELVRQLAMLRRTNGDSRGALRLLEREFQNGNRAAPITSTLSTEYETSGSIDEAIRVCREGLAGDPGNASNYRLALARLEEKRGNLPEAIALLEPDAATTPTGNLSPASVQLMGLYLRAGRSADAKRLALGARQGKDADALIAVSRIFAGTGEKELARSWLATGVRRAKDPKVRFQLQCEILQPRFAPANQPMPNFLRDVRCLQRISQATPALKASYVAVSYDLASQRGADAWLESELKRAWRNGQGEFSAGQSLVSFYLDHHRFDSLEQVMQTIRQMPSLPEQSLRDLAKRLGESDHSALALPILERLNRRTPDDEGYVLGRAQFLWRNGQVDDANRLLEDFDRTSVLRDDRATQIAFLYEELGDSIQAQNYYRRAVQRDPDAVRSQAAYFRLARLETERKNWSEARRLLLAVYRHPVGNADFNPLVSYLSASGRLNTLSPGQLPGAEFPMAFAKRADLIALSYEQPGNSGREEKSLRIVTEHPEYLAVSPVLSAVARKNVLPVQIPILIQAFESALTQTNCASPRLKRDLAALYVHSADQHANGDASDSRCRLANLTRANQLIPDDFDIARQFALLCWEHGQPAVAVDALKPFVTEGSVPSECEQARQLLASH